MTGASDVTGEASATKSDPSVVSEELSDVSLNAEASGEASTSSYGASTGPTATSMGTSETSTGAQQTSGDGPACGDGVREGDEECDDANDVDADGCLSDCTREWFVFVTSEPFTQGDINGLVGADYQCRHRATKMFLPNGERYMAWISTSEVQPVDRMYHARGPYKLVNGLRVAASWDALVTGPLENPINVSELSETVDNIVFTGTLTSGERAGETSHCDDWMNGAGDVFAWYGGSSEVGAEWTYAIESICGEFAAIYCFEQP